MRPSSSTPPRPCVIIALELLGLDADEASGHQLRRTLALVERDFGDSTLFERRFLVTGRRMLRVATVTSSRTGALPFRELLDTVRLQAELIWRRVLIRGAVTIGNVSWRSDMVVGAGILEAERLCKLAEVPRVIVDPLLLREIESNEDLRDHTVPMELGYIRELLRQDTDGLWFIDYLKASSTELDEPAMYSELLEEHRSLIEKRLSECVTLDQSSRASTWLWNYHNQLIDECFTRKAIDGEQKARLRLPARSPLVYAFPPSAKAPG